MRHIAVVSLFASLVAFACDSGQEAASKPEAKAAEAKAAAPAPAAKEYGGELCDTIIPCYQKLEFSGSFVADVTADIEPDGSVSVVSFTGEGPKPVQTCITDAFKATKLADYNGKPGRVHCTQSGQLMGGTQMVMSEHGYEVRDAGAPPAEASP